MTNTLLTGATGDRSLVFCRAVVLWLMTQQLASDRSIIMVEASQSCAGWRAHRHRSHQCLCSQAARGRFALEMVAVIRGPVVESRGVKAGKMAGNKAG